MKKLAPLAALLAVQASAAEPESPMLKHEGLYASRVVHHAKLEERVREVVFRNDHAALLTWKDGLQNLAIYSFATSSQALLATNFSYADELVALKSSFAYTVKETNGLYTLGFWSPTREWQAQGLKYVDITATEGDSLIADVESVNQDEFLLHYSESGSFTQLQKIPASFFKSGRYDDSRYLNGERQPSEILKYTAPSGAEVELYRAPPKAFIFDVRVARDNVSWVTDEEISNDEIRETYHFYYNGIEATLSSVVNESFGLFPSERGLLFTRSDIDSALVHVDILRGPTVWLFAGTVKSAALENNALYVLISNSARSSELMKIALEKHPPHAPTLSMTRSGNTLSLTFQKKTGNAYVLETSPNLQAWNPEKTALRTAFPEEQSLAFPISQEKQFYRLAVIELPPAPDLIPPIP